MGFLIKKTIPFIFPLEISSESSSILTFSKNSQWENHKGGYCNNDKR